MEKTLKDFLAERKIISRWIILVAGLLGAFFGALLMFLISLLGILS